MCSVHFTKHSKVNLKPIKMTPLIENTRSVNCRCSFTPNEIDIIILTIH